MTDKLLTPTQVADIIGITPGNLRIWRDKGIGPPTVTLSPNVYRYRLSDLDEYIERNTHKQKTTPQPPHRRIEWAGLTDAQWEKVRQTLLKNAAGRRCLGRGGDPRKLLDDCLHAVCRGYWPDHNSPDYCLWSRAEAWHKIGIWRLIMLALKDDPDFPFCLSNATFLIAEPTGGKRFAESRVVVLSAACERKIADFSLRKTLTFLLRKRNTL
jgi:hypothetical protein